jgi:energy-coupling factor transporter ATP-binding protein EcfA2
LEVEAILAARAPPSPADKLNEYVQRKELEKTLESFLRKPIAAGGRYMVVVGPRGAGKSTLASHVLSKMGKAVLVVEIDAPSATVPELKSLVLQGALKQYASHSKSLYATTTPVKDGDLADRLKAAASARGEEGWRPTLALEITSSAGGELIKNACRVLKQLTHDQQLCHGILVLSSSFAVAELTDDKDRQHFLRVGAFSRDEASAYLDANFKAHLREEVATIAAVAAVKERILPLTTLPNKVRGLTEAVRSSTSAADFVARADAWASEFEAAAHRDVKGANTNELNIIIRNKTGQERCFPMRDLMRELINTGAPAELPTATCDLPASKFASIIRTSQEAKAVFNVDLVSKTVDFASGAHRQAAAELLPRSPVGLLGWLFGGQM